MAKGPPRRPANCNAGTMKIHHVLPPPGQGEDPAGLIQVAAGIVYRQFLAYEREQGPRREC